MKIYKYPILIVGHLSIEMPQNAKIISFQLQDNLPMLWAIINPDRKPEKRHFRMYGTGQDMDNENQFFIGTIVQSAFVLHLFELEKQDDKE